MSQYKIFILIILLSLGLALQFTGFIDLEKITAEARQYTGHWWLGAILILIQAIMFTFAMAGSSIVWISGALFTPGMSTAIITAGTTLGSVSAYLFSEHLSDEWMQKIKFSRIYQLLQKQGNVPVLFALRVMPGFPHSVINYSSGILKVNFAGFLFATIAGTVIKSYVYSVLIYNTTSQSGLTGSIEFSTVWPLLALSILTLLAVAVRRFLDNH